MSVCPVKVAYYTKEANPSLAKPQESTGNANIFLYYVFSNKFGT